jgi:hypothetical protein
VAVAYSLLAAAAPSSQVNPAQTAQRQCLGLSQNEYGLAKKPAVSDKPVVPL